MKLFAYYQQDYNGFALFFIDPIDNSIIRTSVENIHGLKDLLFGSSGTAFIHKLTKDDKQYVKELLDKSNTEIMKPHQSLLSNEEMDKMLAL